MIHQFCLFRIQANPQAKDVRLWALSARRDLVLALLEAWVERCQEDATVEVLLTALSHPNFKDVKLRVEKLINTS